MIRLRMKYFNMILIEKLQKYQPYHQAKLESMNEKILPLQKQIVERAKCIYSPLQKAFGKQTKRIQDQGKNKLII